MSGQHGERIGEGGEIFELGGADLADIRRSDLEDARSESVERRARAEARGGRRLVDANGDVGRQFVSDFVQDGGNRVHGGLNFRPQHRAYFSRHVLARGEDQAIDFETDARDAGDRREQDRLAMDGDTLGDGAIEKIHVRGKIGSRRWKRRRRTIAVEVEVYRGEQAQTIARDTGAQCFEQEVLAKVRP